MAPRKGVRRGGGGTVAIGNTPVTPQQWSSGALLTALQSGSPAGGTPDAAPGPAPQPYDPAYEAYVNSANRNVSLGNNEATWQTQNLGYDSGFNADGTLNAANPYSQAQLLVDNYKRDQLGTNNSMAAQGQLYSGARLNAQATNDRQYAQGYAGLQRQASKGYHGIQSGRLQNYATNSVGVSDAAFGALQKATYGG
jgi:hypothetical protein